MIFLDEEEFGQCLFEFIDYVVMEYILCVVVVLVEFVWSDVGVWDVFWEIGKLGVDENVIEGDVFIFGVLFSYICSMY